MWTLFLMEIPSVRETDRPMRGRKKQNKTRVWESATPMNHVGWGNQCLDLDVMTCLCCKWLECNRAWPVKLACSQWLALCSLLCLGASLPGVSCHWDQGEAQMFPAALPNLIVGLPVFMESWYDPTPWTQHSRLFAAWMAYYTHHWHRGMSDLSQPDFGCQWFLCFLPTNVLVF